MDYDDDGTLDLVSGSYDPGDLYLFRGLGHGRYAAVKPLTDETGTPLVHHPEELKRYKEFEQQGKQNSDEATRQRVASFGSWPGFVDWDGDGDLDLLIGSFGGEVYLRINKGTRARPVYAAESNRVLDREGQPVGVSEHADVNPVDWDGDGRFDLVIGSGDGSVVWYRNVGADAKPAFGARQELIPARSCSIFLRQFLEPDQLPCSGVRAQIAVADYDHDGRLDLLVGDWSEIQHLRELTPEEAARVEKLRREEASSLQTILKHRDDEAGKDDEQKRAGEANDAALKALGEFAAEEGATQRASSFVWFFRRIGPGAAPASNPPSSAKPPERSGGGG